jgi:Ulp1 family protease
MSTKVRMKCVEIEKLLFKTHQIKQMNDAFENFEPKEIFGIFLVRNDILSLLPGRWLNNHIIECYFNLLVKNRPEINCFSPIFYLEFNSDPQKALRNWYPETNLFSKSKIFIPVIINHHWTLIVIDFVEKKCIHFDSTHHKTFFHLDRIKRFLTLKHLLHFNSEFPSKEWKFYQDFSITKQNNDYDCGVFICKYAEFILKEYSLEFDPIYMPYYRKKILLDILNEDIL